MLAPSSILGLKERIRTSIAAHNITTIRQRGIVVKPDYPENSGADSIFDHRGFGGEMQGAKRAVGSSVWFPSSTHHFHSTVYLTVHSQSVLLT